MSATIVVGYDGTEISARALDRAISEAKAASDRLIVVVVAAMPFDFDPLAPPLAGGWTEPEAELAEDFREGVPPPALEPIVEQARKHAANTGVDPQIIWRLGHPAHEILNIAKANDASTIILGEHHHRHFQALFGQDVDAAVEREANCSVIVVA